MNKILKALLDTPEPIFSQCLHGLEREALRIDSNANLASRAHPAVLGSPLCHPYITTDFSESQIEYTTSPHSGIDVLLTELELLCRYVHLQLDGEWLWPFSMPPRLPSADQIPLALYGSSPRGRQKHIYRRGLARRYGAKMQTISGVHYNFSFGQSFWDAYFRNLGKEATNVEISEAYLGLIRNFLRHIYVFPYLFGNSPALDESFVLDESFASGSEEQTSQAVLRQAKQRLFQAESAKTSYYAPYASSLRQSEIGYNHPSQWNLKISYNSMEEYLKDVCTALTEARQEYTRWPLENQEQLSYAALQIENEHYAPIRPKQNLLKGLERSLTALEKRGIQYLELRCFDIQTCSCCGIDPQSLYFTHLLLCHCLFEPSLPLYPQEEQDIRKNYLRVAWEGRKPDCTIDLESKPSTLREAGTALCARLRVLAERLDAEHGQSCYTQSLDAQEQKFLDPGSVPSARFLADMLTYPGGYWEYGLAQAQKDTAKLDKSPLSKEQMDKFASLSRLSIEEQQRLEKEAQPAPDLDLLPELCR